MESPVLNAHREWVASCGTTPSRQTLSLKAGRFEYRVEYAKPPDAKALRGTLGSGDYRLSGVFEVVAPQPSFHGKPPMLGLRLMADRESARAAGIRQVDVDRSERDLGCAHRIDLFVLDDPCPLLFDGVTVMVPKELAARLAPTARAWLRRNVKAIGSPGVP